jgi:acyl-CoA thioester hydrolase
MTKIRVYYEDTDAGGIVYHSNYLNFCERARSEIFFEKALKPFNNRGGFVVKNLKADFLKPARLGDTLFVKTQLLESKRVSLKLLQDIFLDSEVIFKMYITLVYLQDGKPKKIPDEFIKILNQ